MEVMQFVADAIRDMHAAGVEVRPLRQITDESDFNEVFFDGAFVADDQLIGPEHGGCCISATLRDYARIGLFALGDGVLSDGEHMGQRSDITDQKLSMIKAST